MVAEAGAVRARREPPVLRPLDLRREVAGGRNRYGFGSELAIRRSESAFDATILAGGSPPNACSWPSAAAWNVRAVTPSAPSASSRAPHLRRGLVGERHRQDLAGPEHAARDLVRDAPRNRRRLAGAGAREDADRAAHGLDGLALLRVQAREDVHSPQRTRADRTVSRQDCANYASQVPSLRDLLEVPFGLPADLSDDGGTVLVQWNATGTMQLHRAPWAGGALEQLTDFAEPVGGRFVPGGGRPALQRDEGGNERHQLYLLDAEPGAEPEPLVVEPDFLHVTPRLSHDGRLLAYATNRRNGVDLDVVVRSLETGEERVVFAPGGYSEVGGFSPDGGILTVLRG